MRRDVLPILGLLLLLAAIDQLYRGLHPEVNLVRAALVGATAWAVLWGLCAAGLRRVTPLRGALAIAASAVVSVLGIQSGWLVSRSPLSVAVHGLLLAVAYAALGRIDRVATGMRPLASSRALRIPPERPGPGSYPGQREGRESGAGFAEEGCRFPERLPPPRPGWPRSWSG